MERKFPGKSLHVPLGALLLLGLLGGCNLQTGGNAPSCQHPLFGPETPVEICSDPHDWSTLIHNQGGRVREYPSYVVGGYVRLGPGGSGPALGYLKVPGFPEHRFLIYRRVPIIVGEQCSDGPIQGCFLRHRMYPPFTDRAGELMGGDAVGINFPFAAGREGSTEVEVDWLVQVKRTAMSQLAEDPIHYVRLMEERPYRLNGKSYAFTLVHRVELPPGQGPRVVEDPTPRNPRRAPEHDPYPMTQGYVAYGRQMANAWRTGLGRQLGFRADDPLNPQLERAQHFWDHESYYTFRLASGFVSPPTPYCQPGVGWSLLFYVGSFTPRKIPIEPSMVPPEKYEGNLMEQGTAIEPFVRYQVHLVRLVGRDVVDYTRTASGLMGGWGTEYPQLIHLRMNPHPDYPVFGRGTPPERTLRVGVLYRVTNLLDWRPHPSHPYGEDEWHLVWSDVRLGSRCETLGVGFHTFDRETSARLDGYFGLDAVSESLLDRERFPFRPAPVLSRLSRDAFLDVAPGEVKLPEWATPPGW